MIKLGLEAHHGVGILGFNSPEWFFTYIGAIMVREREGEEKERELGKTKHVFLLLNRNHT